MTYAGSGHHLRPDRIEPDVSYFGKSLPVRPLSLPQFLRRSLLSGRLWFVVCFGKLSLSDIPIRNNQVASDRASAVAEVPSKWRSRRHGPLLRVATIRRTTDIFLFISHTTNALLFKFRYSVFIGVTIIKEISSSLASGTHCIIPEYWCPNTEERTANAWKPSSSMFYKLSSLSFNYLNPKGGISKESQVAMPEP